MLQGTIIRVAGPVVDVQFAAGKLPALQEALTVTAEGTERTMEVTQHVNETTVRLDFFFLTECEIGRKFSTAKVGHMIAFSSSQSSHNNVLELSRIIRIHCFGCDFEMRLDNIRNIA